jgi:membrane associated rhomboid family serine protease
MKPFWKIFFGIFCFISALIGVVFAVISETHKPAATSDAVLFGALGVAFGLGGMALFRKPRY